MPKARNRWERCNQILAWAKTEFPIPAETRLRVAKKVLYKKQECAGLTYRERGRMYIALSSSALPNEFCATLILMHELGHAWLFDEGLGMEHGPRFRECAGKIEDAWEHHGLSDSETFPVD